MEIQSIKTLTFPNVFSLRENIVQMRIRLKELADVPTKDIPGLNESIRECFPGLTAHKCSLGYEGGFLERLSEGTYLAHVVEHLSLELQQMLGYDVKFGRARQVKDDLYQVLFACPNASIGQVCAHFVMEFVNGCIDGAKVDFPTRLIELRGKCAKYELGPSTAALAAEARRRGIPLHEIDDSGILRLGTGKYQKYLSSTIVESTSSIAVDMACDKALTKFLLREEGIVVPRGSICTSEDEAVSMADELGYPLVLKPKHGNHGKFVFIGLENEMSLREAFGKILPYDKEVLVERCVKGRDYRLLVVDGKFVACAERIKAHVVGDGTHTIEELVDISNRDVRRGEAHEKPLTKIAVDDLTKRILVAQNLTLFDIPKKDCMVWLKDTANLSTGGTARDCTDLVHATNIEIAQKAALCLGLDVAGIDVVTPDISLPMDETGGAVIEVNAAPGLRMHLYPSVGKPREVAGPILDMLYPPGSPHSVPIVSITGTNGKTTTSRMIRHILEQDGRVVGQTSTGGIFIGGKCVECGDTTGPISARKVLNNRIIDVAVLETARGGILREGLAYEKADVAILTNLSADHLGLDEVGTLEELFHVKSLVIEAVKETGLCILNGDDPWLSKAMERAKGEVLLISLNPANEQLRDHVRNGGRVLTVQDGSIVLSDSQSDQRILDVSAIPATLRGTLKHNIYNALCAIGACLGLGVPVQTIATSLERFRADVHCNPGRFNIFEMAGYKIVLDYGHNPDGYQNTLDALPAIGASRLVGIIGVPGDRRNEDISAIGALCARVFDKIIIKEDEDKRGRRPQEVANLLFEAATQSGARSDALEIIADEEKALVAAIEDAKEGDCIVLFYEKLEPALDLIEEFKLFEKQAVKV